MRQFYKVSQKWQTLSAKLSWSHFCEIIWFDDDKFQYYIKITGLNNLEKSKIYRTDQDRSITFKIRKNKLKIKTCCR